MRLLKAIVAPPAIVAVALGAIIAIDWVIDNHIRWVIGAIVLAVWVFWSFMEYRTNG